MLAHSIHRDQIRLLCAGHCILGVSKLVYIPAELATWQLNVTQQLPTDEEQTAAGHQALSGPKHSCTIVGTALLSCPPRHLRSVAGDHAAAAWAPQNPRAERGGGACHCPGNSSPLPLPPPKWIQGCALEP